MLAMVRAVRSLTSPEGDSPKRLDVQFPLEDLPDLALLGSLLHFLPPDHVHILGRQDEVPFDRLCT